MLFHETKLEGVWLIDIEPQNDERGFFARTFCEDEFSAKALETRFVQHSTSQTACKGAVRGMHFQAPPHEEVKVVRCLKGAIYDVVVDIRSASPTLGRWQAFELTADGNRQLYIPKGFAHGFQTLADDAVVGYLISSVMSPDAARGLRHDDPAIAIQWPLPLTMISERDKSWPDWRS